MNNKLDICKNECEEEMFYLFGEIYNCNKVRDELKRTVIYLNNHIAYCSKILLTLLISYLKKDEHNKSTLNYENNGRTYKDCEKIKLKNFVEKYKKYRDKKIAHFESKEIEVPNISIKDFYEILCCIFKCSFEIDDWGLREFYKGGLSRIIEIENESKKIKEEIK